MVLVPLVLVTRPHVLGATGYYGKQNVPYGPAIAEILASNKDRPSIIVATEQQLAGNLRLHATDIPVTVPGYERFEQPYQFDATHPVLLVWRSAQRQTRTRSRMQQFAAGSTERDWLERNWTYTTSLCRITTGERATFTISAMPGFTPADGSDTAACSVQGIRKSTGKAPETCAVSIISKNGIATRNTSPSSSVIKRMLGLKPAVSPSR